VVRRTARCGNVNDQETVPVTGRSELPDAGKTMSDADELRPVDYVVVAFPAGQVKFSGEMASELKALMESNTVRVLDLLLLTKDADGAVEASELRDADDSAVGQLRAAEADLAVLRPDGGQRPHPHPGDPGRDRRRPSRPSGKDLTCRC